MSRPNNSAGFTIVELLIVVVVIAILAAVTVVAYNGITQQANETAVKNDLLSASKQLELTKTTIGALNETTLSEYFVKTYGGTVIEYQYGDDQYFCLNGTNASKNLRFYVESKDGLSAIKPGQCPTIFTSAASQCLSSRAYVSVGLQNQSGSSVTATYSAPSIPAANQGTQTVAAGNTMNVSLNSYAATISTGVGKIVVQNSDGSSFVRFHRYAGVSC